MVKNEQMDGAWGWVVVFGSFMVSFFGNSIIVNIKLIY